MWKKLSEIDNQTKYPDHPTIYLMTELLNTIQELIQVPLLYHSRRLCTETPDQLRNIALAKRRQERKQFTDWARPVFIGILFHLTLSNFANWYIDNFIATRNHTLTLHSIYFYPENWLLVNNFITPLIVFFRFHCMLLFFKVWRSLAEMQFQNEHVPQIIH